MTTPQMQKLAEDQVMNLIYKTFAPELPAWKHITTVGWKDGNAITKPSFSMMQFANDVAALRAAPEVDRVTIIQRALLDDDCYGNKAADQDDLEECARGSAVMIEAALSTPAHS